MQKRLSGNELLDSWEEAKSQGLSARNFAKMYGFPTVKSLESALYRAREKKKSSPEEPKIIDEVVDNHRFVTYLSPEIRSLEQLIDACKIDMKVWNIYKHVINKYPGYAKLKQQEVYYEDGRIVSGFVKSDGKLTVVPMFQVKAWMVLREPEPIKPVIRPISIKAKIPKSRQKKAKPRGKALFLPDLHFGFRRDVTNGKLMPFHERSALDIILQIMQSDSFDYVIYLGDVLDWSSWSDKFVRKPEFAFTTQPALNEFGWWMQIFRQLQPNAEHVLLDSNHEQRLERMLTVHLQEAYGLKPALGYKIHPVMSVPNLLALDQLGIKWVPGYEDGNAQYWINDNLYSEHGKIARQNPGDTVREIAKYAPANVVFGHIHRNESATYTRDMRDGYKTISAVCPGCLCRVDYVVPGHRKGQNWQQGFAVAEYDGEYVNIQTYEILYGKTIYNGKVYVGKDRTKEIEKAVL